MTHLGLGLGLLGFIEPCTLGTNLLLIKHLEGQTGPVKRTQILLFTLTRALWMGLLGLGAALLGAGFLSMQRGLWVGFGSLYLTMGMIYLAGRRQWLTVALGPSLTGATLGRRTALMGILFGLNIPACAIPLLVTLLGINAAASAGGSSLWQGFFSLVVFGLALSAPLILAFSWSPMARLMDRLASLSSRVPRWTGIVLVGLGLWSIGFGLFSASPVTH